MQLIDDQTLHDGVRHLTELEPSFSEVIRMHGVPPIWLRPQGFATLVLIILEQQVSLQSARAAYDKLAAKLGTVTAAGLLGLTDRQLKKIGFSRQKTGYCRELASRVIDKSLDLEGLERLDTPEVIDTLTSVRGIGQWTARIYSIMALARPDVWPSGDLALRKSFALLNGLAEIPDDRSMEAESEKWRPWQSVAARILWHYYLSQNNLKSAF
jgi:DNA-3-methyladenine glycosylase II